MSDDPRAGPPPGDPLAPSAAAATLEAIRARTPLIHNLTNLVVTNSTANALLALGASPAMVEGVEEVAEFAALADALVVNLGTMSGARARAMRLAAAAARAAGRPWVLDPVAVGVIEFRSSVAAALLDEGPAVVRGNASEILALARLSGASASEGPAGRGVDSRAGAEQALAAAAALARRSGAAVVVSGATDYATDGQAVAAIGNGHPLMPRVTGLGCTASAIIAACLAVRSDRLAAAAHGMVLTGLAGELAGAASPGPGSLQVALLDALYGLTPAIVRERGRLGRAALSA